METSTLPVKGCRKTYALRSGSLSCKGSLSCNNCCDKGPRFSRFHKKDRPSKSPFMTHNRVSRIYSYPDHHGLLLHWQKNLKSICSWFVTRFDKILPSLYKSPLWVTDSYAGRTTATNQPWGAPFLKINNLNHCGCQIWIFFSDIFFEKCCWKIPLHPPPLPPVILCYFSQFSIFSSNPYTYPKIFCYVTTMTFRCPPVMSFTSVMFRFIYLINIMR
jgi:hypothetical protein